MEPPVLDDGADGAAAPVGREMAAMGCSVAAAANTATTRPQRSVTLDPQAVLGGWYRQIPGQARLQGDALAGSTWL